MIRLLLFKLHCYHSKPSTLHHISSSSDEKCETEKKQSLYENKKFHCLLFWYFSDFFSLFPQLNNFCVIIKKSVSAEHVLPTTLMSKISRYKTRPALLNGPERGEQKSPMSSMIEVTHWMYLSHAAVHKIFWHFLGHKMLLFGTTHSPKGREGPALPYLPYLWI